MNIKVYHSNESGMKLSVIENLTRMIKIAMMVMLMTMKVLQLKPEYNAGYGHIQNAVVVDNTIIAFNYI